MSAVPAPPVPAAPMEQEPNQVAGVVPVAPAGEVHPGTINNTNTTIFEGAEPEARAREARSPRAFTSARADRCCYYGAARIQGKVTMTTDVIADKTASLVNEVFGKMPQCILRAKSLSSFNQDTKTHTSTGMAKFWCKPFDGKWEAEARTAIKNNVIVITGGLPPDAIRLAVKKGSSYSMVASNLCAAFAYGRESGMAKSPGGTNRLSGANVNLFFAESGGIYEPRNGKMWRDGVFSITGITRGNLAYLIGEYNDKSKDAVEKVLTVVNDEIMFTDKHHYGECVFTAAEDLVVQRGFFCVSKIPAREFHSGNSGSSVLIELFGDCVKETQGGKGAEGKFKNTNISTLKVIVNESDLASVDKTLNGLVKEGTIQFTLDECEADITFF